MDSFLFSVKTRWFICELMATLSLISRKSTVFLTKLVLMLNFCFLSVFIILIKEDLIVIFFNQNYKNRIKTPILHQKHDRARLSLTFSFLN